MSSATVTFACMKSWTASGRHGVEGLPLKRHLERRRAAAGSSRRELRVLRPLLEHRRDLRARRPRRRCRSCRARPARSGSPAPGPRSSPARRSAPAARAGRSRRAIRCESSSPCPGVNQAAPARRRRRAVGLDVAAALDVAPLPELAEVARVGGRRAAESSTVASTFSWRVQESIVQLAEPVQTASPSRTTYLWCIRSGMPGMPFARRPELLEHVALGARRRRLEGRRSGPGVVVVEGQPHPHAAAHGGAQRVGDGVADRAGQPHVVERELERPRGRAEPVHEPLADRLGRLRAVLQGVHVQHALAPHPGPLDFNTDCEGLI